MIYNLYIDEVKRVQNERDDKAAKLNKYQEHCDTLQAKYSNLIDKNHESESECKKLNTCYEQLEAMWDKTKDKCNDFENKYNQLRDKYNNLVDKHDKSQAQNSQSNVEFRSLRESLEARNEALNTQL